MIKIIIELCEDVVYDLLGSMESESESLEEHIEGILVDHVEALEKGAEEEVEAREETDKEGAGA